MKCVLCNKEVSSHIRSHLLTEHSNEFESSMSDQEIKWKYYYKFYHPEESGYCPYCNQRKSLPRFTRPYETCASKECIALYSSKGAKSQIKLYGGTANWHRRLIEHKVDTGAGLRAVNKHKRDFFIETGWRTKEEQLFGEKLKLEGIVYSYQDHRFHHSHTGNKKVDINFIPDFIVNDVIIEIDGWYHDTRVEQDERRDKYSLEHGYKVLRIKAERVYDQLDMIIDTLKTLLTSTTIERKILS